MLGHFVLVMWIESLNMRYALVSVSLLLAAPVVSAQHAAAPNPPIQSPAAQLPVAISSVRTADEISQALVAIPGTEWSRHKSNDGAVPSNAEQRMLWLMNRARANPTAEGVFLANTGDADVVSAINFLT